MLSAMLLLLLSKFSRLNWKTTPLGEINWASAYSMRDLLNLMEIKKVCQVSWPHFEEILHAIHHSEKCLLITHPHFYSCLLWLPRSLKWEIEGYWVECDQVFMFFFLTLDKNNIIRLYINFHQIFTKCAFINVIKHLRKFNYHFVDKGCVKFLSPS